MRCKVYLEKSNGHVEVQLRAARILAGCHSLGGESVKFSAFGIYSFSANGFRSLALTCSVAPRKWMIMASYYEMRAFLFDGT